jgi:pyrroloquinoline quinone (PQQ) biosynthesis protein C
MATPGDDIVEVIAERCVAAAADWSWFHEKLTPGQAQAWMLQHSIRNRLFSSVWRPAWMSRCPDQAIVRKTIGQMLEELVYDKGIEAAHTKILWEMGRTIGLTDEQLNNAQPVPKVDLYNNITENLCRNRHWIIGWLSTSLEEFVLTAYEGQTSMDYRKWQSDLGLTEKQVFFFSYHQIADMEHAGKKVWRPIRSHVTTDELAEDVLAGLDTALNAATLFYEGIKKLGNELDDAGATIPNAA